MNAGRALLAFVLLAAGSGTIFAQDLGALYSEAELRDSASRYSDNLRGLWREDLLSRLTSNELAGAQRIALELPLIGHNRNPFEFYSQSQTQRVVSPIMSVRFLDDLSIAFAYFDRNRCDAGVVLDYVGSLRYGRGPVRPPLVALGISRKEALADDYVDDVSGKTFKSAVYFILAHEYAHVFYRHAGVGTIGAKQSQDQEIAADSFALDVMRRIGVAPLGLVFYFAALSRFERAPSEFRSPAEYESAVRERATHPLSSARLLRLAEGIDRDAKSFARLQANPDAWIPRIRDMAAQIATSARNLDDRDMREFLALRSRSVSAAELRQACTR